MAYIGQQPFQEFSSVPTKDSFTGDGSTTTFDLANDVVRGAENALEVFVDNVRQEPGSGKAFTLGVDGSNNYRRITFTAAPANSSVIYVINDKTNLSAIAPVNTDFNGAELVLDADADTTLHADTDDEIDVRIGGNDVIMLKQSSGDGIITIPTDAKDLQFTQFDGYKVLEINDAGFVGVGGNSNAAGEIRIYEDTDNGSNYSGFKAAASTTSSVAYQLPAADGSDGQQLTTDGSGVLSWSSAGTTLANDANNRVVTGTGSGLNGEANLTFDGSTLAVTGALTASGAITGSSTVQGTTITATTAFVPDASDGAALGTTALEFSDLFLADGAVINFGDDQDVTLTHTADTGLTLNSTMKLMFNDATQFIQGASGTVLDIAATDEIELTATLIDVVGNLAGSGTGTFAGILKTDDTTEATSTTDGSLQTDGGLSVAKDIVAGDDIKLLSDASVIHFGANSEITLTHSHDAGLNLKHTATADDKPVILTLQTGETDIAANDVIGTINFQAPDEGTGTDAILVAAGIAAISEGDFSSSNNATKLSFRTAASEAASEKMSLSSAGILTVADDIIIGDGKTIGSASDPDAITIASGGGVTFTQTPVFPDGSLALADLDIDGGTDIGADIVDADLFIIDDGAGGTNRKTTASRVKTYIGAATTIGALTDVTMDKASVGAGGGNFLYSILIDPASDGSAPDLDAVTGNANNNYGIGKDTFSALTTGSANVAIGEGAGKALTTGYSNVIIGGDAGDAMTEGLENVCVGVGAGSAITTGDYNVCMGRNALDANTTGNNNTAIGKDALGWLDGSNSTALGWQAGGSSAGASSLYLGYQAYGSGNSDEIILTGSGNPVSAGSDAFTFGKNGNRVYNQFNSNNNWTHSSDERMKKNIQNETLGLSFINRLRPVTYNFRLPSEYPEDFPYYDAENKNPKTDQLQHGILAQEVKAAMTAEGNDTFNGYQLANDGVHSVSESNFVYPMIKAMQELSAKVDALETENTALKARVKTLEDA